jgi:hypothetical protein
MRKLSNWLELCAHSVRRASSVRRPRCRGIEGLRSQPSPWNAEKQAERRRLRSASVASVSVLPVKSSP